MTAHSEFDAPERAPSNFHNLIAGDQRLQARWDAVAETVIAHGKAVGVVLTRNDVERIPSARLAVLTDAPLGGEIYERELANLPSVAEAKRKAEVAAKVAAGDEESRAELDRMRPAERMTFARENGLDKSAPATPESADDEAAKMRILLSLNGSARIAQARKWGMA